MTTGVAAAAIGVLVWLAGYSRETAAVVLLVGLAKCVESVSDVLHGAMQRGADGADFRVDDRAGACSLWAVALVVYWTRSVLWGTVAFCGAAVVSLVAVDAVNMARLAGGGLGALRPVWEFGAWGGWQSPRCR